MHFLLEAVTKDIFFIKIVIPEGKMMTNELIHDSYYGQVVAKHLFMGQFLS